MRSTTDGLTDGVSKSPEPTEGGTAPTPTSRRIKPTHIWRRGINDEVKVVQLSEGEGHSAIKVGDAMHVVPSTHLSPIDYTPRQGVSVTLRGSKGEWGVLYTHGQLAWINQGEKHGIKPFEVLEVVV